MQDQATPREFTDQLHEAYTRAVMNSSSWLVVFQIQDVFAQTDRFNTPGSVSMKNWSHRLTATVKQLDRTPHLLAKAKMFTRTAQDSRRAI